MRGPIFTIASLLFVAGHVVPAGGSTLNARLWENSLPPIGHTLFCQNHPLECAYRPPSPRFLTESAGRLYAELTLVHRRINMSIKPVQALLGKTRSMAQWDVLPLSGDCNDYAVSKRHELLQRGWPSWALLLAEVTLPSGEHHLVLIANLRGDSYVLDNLETDPLSLLDTDRYRWNRIESAEDPKLWKSMERKPDLAKRQAGLSVAINPSR